MEIIPAIDLMKGKIVRLTRGDPKTMKVYEHFGDPITVAGRWEKEGADAIHVIDLDAALDKGSNFEVIERIARCVHIPVQVGGGIRTLESAQTLLRMRIDRIIVGALAFKEPHALTKLLQDFSPKRVVVALDHRDGEVMVRGWKTATKLGVEEAMKEFVRRGARRFLITSITKDGTLMGPEYDILRRACRHPKVKVIAAGGVGSLEDLVTLKRIGVWGVVIGKALYEGVFSLRKAIEIKRGG